MLSTGYYYRIGYRLCSPTPSVVTYVRLVRGIKAGPPVHYEAGGNESPDPLAGWGKGMMRLITSLQSRDFVTQGRVCSVVRFPGNRCATSANRLEGSPTMSRAQLTRGFLWFSVLGWGIGLGAKLFDLIVVARAWGDAPPTSLTLMLTADVIQ